MIDLVREDVSLCTKINMVKYMVFISTLLLLLATPYCHALGYTLDDANHIIEKNRAMDIRWMMPTISSKKTGQASRLTLL